MELGNGTGWIGGGTRGIWPRIPMDYVTFLCGQQATCLHSASPSPGGARRPGGYFCPDRLAEKCEQNGGDEMEFPKKGEE